MKKCMIKKMNTKKNTLEYTLYSDLDTNGEMYTEEIIQGTDLVHGYANTSACINQQLKTLRRNLQHMHQPYALVHYAHVNIFCPQPNADYSLLLILLACRDGGLLFYIPFEGLFYNHCFIINNYFLLVYYKYLKKSIREMQEKWLTK